MAQPLQPIDWYHQLMECSIARKRRTTIAYHSLTSLRPLQPIDLFKRANPLKIAQQHPAMLTLLLTHFPKPIHSPIIKNDRLTERTNQQQDIFITPAYASNKP